METTTYRTKFWGVQVRKRRPPVNPGTLSRTLDFVQKGNGVSAAEVSEGIGKCIRTTYRSLEILMQKGCISKSTMMNFSRDGRELKPGSGYYYEPGTTIN